MAVVTTFYLKTFVWNSVTFDKSSGGTLELRFEHEGEPLKGWTGDDEYPTFLAVVNKGCRVILRLRDVSQKQAPGAANSNIVATLRIPSDTGNPTITFATMTLIAVRGTQGRAQTGDVELVFEHLSANGTTNPVT
jgi:hypothetical protein